VSFGISKKLNSRFEDRSKLDRDYITHMTTTYSNNRKTGRALRCINAQYADQDFREHNSLKV
jgi:hypothetical protein